MDKQVDYHLYADRFADLVEIFVWRCVVVDKNKKLSNVCRLSLNILKAYQKEVGNRRFRIDALMKLAKQRILAEDKDPCTEVLKTISYGPEGLHEHVNDLQDPYLNVCEWLEYETGLEVEA